METSKKYLVLEFSDAGMLLEWNVSNPSVKKICELEDVKGNCIFRGHNVGGSNTLYNLEQYACQTYGLCASTD